MRLNILCWFGHVQRTEENRIHKKVLSMNLGTKRLTGRPRNRWQDEVRKDGRLAGGITQQRGMEEAAENGNELSHSAHANGMNE